MTEPNPLLEPWTAAFGLPPFAQVRAEHFEPAFRQAMAEHRAELRAITEQTEAPSFDNTVAAFDRCGRLLGRIGALFYNLTASETSPALQQVQLAMAGPLAEHNSAVHMDARLFARIDELHRRRAELGLLPEQRRLLERVHLDFVRAGACLQGAAQQRYAAIMSELASLTTRFAQNVLHDENAFRLQLAGEADLAGLPPFLRAAARQAAAERGLPGGHVITLSRSLVVPFLTFSQRRDLREQAWRAWVSRGEHAGAHDNREIARAILRLRQEQARLQGHPSYADFALSDTMAGRRAAVQGLLDEVWPRALDAAGREREAVLQAMQGAGAEHPLEPWDWRYWAEKVRVARYAVDDAEVKPYSIRVHVVIASVDNIHFEIDDRVATNDSVEDSLFDALLAGRDIFLGDRAADDLVLDRQSLAAFRGPDIHDDVAILTTTTGLLDQLSFTGGRRGDRFAIGDLRLAGVGFNLEFAEHAVANDLEVKFAHPGDDSLAGILVGEDAEGGILFGKALKCGGHLFLVDLGLGFDRHRNYRVRE